MAEQGKSSNKNPQSYVKKKKTKSKQPSSSLSPLQLISSPSQSDHKHSPKPLKSRHVAIEKYTVEPDDVKDYITIGINDEDDDDPMIYAHASDRMLENNSIHDILEINVLKFPFTIASDKLLKSTMFCDFLKDKTKGDVLNAKQLMTLHKDILNGYGYAQGLQLHVKVYVDKEEGLIFDDVIPFFTMKYITMIFIPDLVKSIDERNEELDGFFVNGKLMDRKVKLFNMYIYIYILTFMFAILRDNEL